MTTIVSRPVGSADGTAAAPAGFWRLVAAQTRGWLAAEAVDVRDAIVLLPFAQLLPLARQAFGDQGVWLPRIETTQTLAAALGPPTAAEYGQVSFDATLDTLVARQLLRSRRWGEAWARRDPQGFERAVGSVVLTAHALLQAAAAVPPQLRAGHWAAAREALPPLAGPGATERLLAQVAVEWASLAPPPASDRLHGLRPAAWILLQAGGADPLATCLLASSSQPALLLDADAGLPLLSGQWARAASPPTLAVCAGFEQEAQSAAAQVLEHLRRGEAPVALIAQDRLLIRRIRALLERDAVTVDDETGWKLSTTRAAGLVMALLRAARPDADSDALLDWLKAIPNRSGSSHSASVDAFEARLRQGGIARVAAIDAAFAEPAGDGGPTGDLRADAAAAVARDAAPDAARRLWSAAAPVLQGLHGRGKRSLPEWVDALRQALTACGAWTALLQDDAGRRVVALLRLQPQDPAGSAWAVAAQAVVLGLGAFTDWVDRVLEAANFTPTLAADTPAEVVITPLPRAMLRPFAAVVFPGTDDRHLGGSPAADGLLGDAQARALGMADTAARRQAELLAFGQLLRGPNITFLRRGLDGAEPLGPSALVARLDLVLATSGRRLAPWQDPRGQRQVAATPVRPGAPPAADRLPDRLSASACEALRACPYRFFALNLLRLAEAQELHGEVEKRDYGNWLHAVLHAFHQGRGEPPDAWRADSARLFAIADETRARLGIAAAHFVPWAASFAGFAPRYLDWLHGREAAGWRWSGGEVERVIAPDGFAGIALRGIIDRIDLRHPGPGAPALGLPATQTATELIDYKTGAAAGFKKKLRDPLEDTQLAVYAALMPAGSEVTAAYLLLDDADGIKTIEHPQVGESAAALLAGLAHDLARIRAGHGLPAHGAGAACDFCHARGICRRDHWSAAASGDIGEATA